MRKSNAFGLIAAVLLPISAGAQTLNPDRPDRYTVKKGDTLWDIAGQFLADPRRWPEIWRANPQVDNPDLIYPGDEIVLVYRDGAPVLEVRRPGERPTVKLSPEVRVLPLDEVAERAIPIDAIQQFLTRPRVVAPEALDEAPYIVSLEAEHLVGGAGHKIYARGLGPEPESRYTVYRRGDPYLDPDDPERVLGYEAVHVADAALERVGDPATLILSRSNREVLSGDRLLPAVEEPLPSSFTPRPPETPVRGRIIAMLEGVRQIGQHQVVVVNLGTEDGIEQGHVLAIYQAGETIADPYAREPEAPKVSYIELDPERQGGIDGFSIAADRAVRDLQAILLEQWNRFAHPGVRDNQKVTLPEEQAGLLMVYRPFARVSYALVIDAVRSIHLHDIVRNP